MSAHKALYERYVQALGTKDLGVQERELDAILAPDFVAHDLIAILPPGDGAALKTFRRRVQQAFPYQMMRIEDLIEEGDRVASRQRVTGTHRGPYLHVAPTGTAITVELLEIVRICEGKIAERWVAFDRGGLLAALEGASGHNGGGG